MLPPLRRRGAVRSTFLLVLLALVAGCSGTTSTGPGPGSAADHQDRPAAASAAPSSTLDGPPDPDRVDTRARHLDRALTQALAECMRTHGHPQLSDTMPAQDRGPRLRRPVLGVHAAELGPTSAAQAEAYGMLGTGLLFTDPPRPIVESTAAAYDPALTGCMARLPDARVVFERLAGWRTLTNELRQDLLTRVDGPLREILRRQLGCVRRTGYPALPLDTFLDGDTRAALRTLQIPVGTFSAAPADPPPLPSDTTRVLPAPPEQTYTPTPAEVAFALTYVRCGRSTNVEAALARAIGPVAQRLAAARASDVASYDAYFAKRLSDLGATG
jgi:hypothetical protein